MMLHGSGWTASVYISAKNRSGPVQTTYPR